MLEDALEAMPVIAILRGVTPEEVSDIGSVLYDNGVRCVEVPLNSPSPLDSIRALADTLPTDCLIGAGTVLSADNVKQVKAAGGSLIVTPNTFDGVIRAALEEDMQVIPGVATPTDAFHALRLGASFLKLFPASTYGPDHLRALLAVLPREVRVVVVGGVGPADFGAWCAAGAAGFGIGSELYRAGDSVDEVGRKAAAIIGQARRCRSPSE